MRPVQDDVPSLLSKWTRQEQVLDGLRVLVAKEAPRVVLQAAAGEAVGSPASVQAGEPVEEADARRRPILPGELPCIAAQGAIESGEVG